MAPKLPQQFGQYKLIELIARGGMAEVFRATTAGIGGFEKTVAVKKILPHLAENDEFITMLIDEARIVVSLNHANIAQVHDLGVIDDTYYIAMEFVHGLDLDGMLKALEPVGGRLPVEHATFIASGLCAGLHAAHSKLDQHGRPLHVVHRDVSPHNVLVSYAGDVKIIDFGVAKARNKETHTKMGVIKGKLLFMAPEQAMAKDIDGRADLFAAGLILYKMLTGVLPFEGENEFQIYNNILSKEIVPPRVLNPAVPEELNQITMMLLQRDPEKRYQDGYSAKIDLDRALHHIAPGYSVSRLSRFIEDEVMTGRRNESGPNPLAANTPPFNSHDTGASQQNQPRQSMTSDRFPAVPPPSTVGSFQAQPPAFNSSASGGFPAANTFSASPHTSQTVERGALQAPPTFVPPNGNNGAAPWGQGLSTNPVGEDATGQFNVPPTGQTQKGGFPVLPLLGIVAMILAIAAMVIYTLFFKAAETTDSPDPEVVAPESVVEKVALPEPVDPEPAELAIAEGTEDAGAADDGAQELAPVEVIITSTPSLAAVFLDGERFGETPAILTLPASDTAISVRIEADGHEPAEFEVVPDESKDKKVSLTPIKAPLAPIGLGKPEPKPAGTPKVDAPKTTKKPASKTPKKTTKKTTKKPPKDDGFEVDLLGDDEPAPKKKTSKNDEEIINPFDL